MRRLISLISGKPEVHSIISLKKCNPPDIKFYLDKVNNKFSSYCVMLIKWGVGWGVGVEILFLVRIPLASASASASA